MGGKNEKQEVHLKSNYFIGMFGACVDMRDPACRTVFFLFFLRSAGKINKNPKAHSGAPGLGC